MCFGELHDVRQQNLVMSIKFQNVAKRPIWFLIPAH